MKEFHPHRRFIAYEPPQKDVFGMWKQDEGKEVIVEDETPKEEVPKNDISTEDTPKEDASKEDISKDKASKDNNSQTVETKTISPSVSPQNETSSTVQSTEDDRSWHVVKGKRKKGRSNSSTEHEEKKRLSNPSKLNYKKVIQKSLQNKTTIPTVVTGANPSPLKNKTPNKESSNQSLPNKTPSKESSSITSFLSSLPPLYETLPHNETPQQRETSQRSETSQPAETAPQSNIPQQTETPQQIETPTQSFVSPPFHIPTGNPHNFDYDYNQDYGFGSFDADISLDPYYYEPNDPPYSFGSGLWPKTHYGEWREREMDLEREPWLFRNNSGFGGYIDDGLTQTLPVAYSSEELQVEMGVDYDV